MQTHPLHVSNGRDRVLEIRTALFVLPEVLEVYITGRPDVVVVVCAGRQRPTRWVHALRAAGYETLTRRHADLRTTAMKASGLPEIALEQAA